MPQSFTLSPVPRQQFLDANGAPLSGGKITTYLAGTVNKQATYADSLGVENANPIILDSAGRATIFLGAFAYRFEVADSTGAAVYTQDNIFDAHLVDATTFISRIKGSATLNFPSTATQTSADLTMVVTGAVLGDYVIVAPPLGSFITDTLYTAHVSLADQVTVRFHNYSTAAQNPASGIFKVSVIAQ